MVYVSHVCWGLFILVLVCAIRSVVSVDPCSYSVQPFDVATTEQANYLAEALNCSGGGIFEVLWEGTVVVDQAFALKDGSVVTITGVGSGAIVDGGGTTQLFTVNNATLNITDVRLENGDGLGGDVDVSDGNGGAVWAGGVDSVIYFSGATAFNNNEAISGGAVSIVDGATASWSGDAYFIGNTATGANGGAVHILNGSSVSWNGQTDFTDNVALIQGGALYSVGGVITLVGKTTFTSSSASTGGGAIFAEESVVSWSGVTSFEDSKLVDQGERGGTVEVDASVLSWRGETSFNGGRGFQRGALFASGSTISWEGETSFCDNSAEYTGGALHVERSSNVLWTGDTVFCNNKVDESTLDGAGGGAIYVANSMLEWGGLTTITNNSAPAGGAIFGAYGADMVLGGATIISENIASSNGGALAIGREVSLDLEAVGTILSLTRNAAGVAGGALYQTATSNGVTWKDAMFISNSARNGGAVYSVSSGIAAAKSVEYPSKYINCTFVDNTAAASGGAMESIAGVDVFINTTFKGNTAGAIGGGLRMAGTTTLTYCEFEGNGANEAGPAVASVGTIVVTDSLFKNNGLLCTSGTFLNYTVEGNGTQASTDYYYSICEGCEICIGRCKVDGNGTQECIPALENTKSSGVDDAGVPITLETLYILPGYWRAISSTSTILPCWNEDACLGGITDDTYKCAEGYSGPYCAICSEDYTRTLAYTCGKCSSGDGVAFAVVAILFTLAALVGVIFYLMSNARDQNKTRFRRMLQRLPVQGLKTVVVAWQILTQFDSVANVTYAGVYGQFLDEISSLISLDLGLVLPAGCMVTTDFHDRLIISTLGPIVALGALGLTFQVATRRNHGSRETLRAVRRKHVSLALLVSFLVYSSVSSTVFRVFGCETLDDGKVYLRADYTIECTTAKHKALQVYAVFMIVLYPIGIPVLYGTIMCKNRKVLNEWRHHSVRQSADLEVTADLWKPYKPARYYYEVIECARRVTLTGVVVFIYPNTAAQVAVTLVLVFMFVMVSESLAPYASTQDAWLTRVAHIVVFLSMFQALVVKVDVSDESSASQDVFGGVLLAANISMVAAVITEAIMVVCSVCRRGGADFDESVAPGVRNTTSRSVDEGWDMIEGDAAPTSNGTAS